jgi:hypothetical protein
MASLDRCRRPDADAAIPRMDDKSGTAPVIHCPRESDVMGTPQEAVRAHRTGSFT